MTVRFCAALLGLLLAASRAGADDALPPANTDSPKLGAIETEYAADFLRFEPTQATRLGFHDGDGRLPDLSAGAYGARVATSRRYLARLAQLDATALSPEDAADVEIMSAMLGREVLVDETEQRWRHDPGAYGRAASDAVSDLVARGFAPIDVRMRSAISREEAIPAMLAAAQGNITTVDATTAIVAQSELRAATDFFRTVPQAFASVNDSWLQAKLKETNDAAIVALGKYQDAMMTGPLAHPSGTFAIGADAFTRELALGEGRPIDLRRYERAGEAALARTSAEFTATAKAIDPHATPNAIYAQLQHDHPDADNLMPATEHELADLRTFVLANHLVTFPAETTVLVRETPDYARQTTLATMSEPGAFEKVSTQAYYFVTPVDPSWTPEQKERHLEFFNYAAFPVILAEDVMPGSVDYALHKTQHLSLVRQIFSSPSYTDGWAHYSEQLLLETGMGDHEPRIKLAALALELQREARYLVGLRLHTQGLTIEDATRFFVENAYLSEADARTEALRGVRDPFYGCYTLGKLEILKLRDDYKKKMGPAYTLQAFNDAFLAHGSPPIGVLRTLLLGKDDDGTLL